MSSSYTNLVPCQPVTYTSIAGCRVTLNASAGFFPAGQHFHLVLESADVAVMQVAVLRSKHVWPDIKIETGAH